MPRINFELTGDEVRALVRGEAISLGKLGEYREVTITSKEKRARHDRTDFFTDELLWGGSRISVTNHPNCGLPNYSQDK
ncbi:hypothetical protein [Enterococcus dongliensis]|uniref:hypothetical protein n=1 Tax=Enterococcus dongliensis TaxID=2559925 RepID=UPI00288FDA20|nr:hypothetical protein [Enterococcus dongliensis]MDT2674306.1 hypothetical protein [Enterococcus dongliensis]